MVLSIQGLQGVINEERQEGHRRGSLLYCPIRQLGSDRHGKGWWEEITSWVNASRKHWMNAGQEAEWRA